MMGWQILYHDQSTCSNVDGGPELVPRRGVLVIIQDHKQNGAEIVTGCDYYGWNDGRWQGYDIFGMYDYLLDPGWKVVLFGRMVTQEEYNAIMRKAGVVKETWHKRERRYG